MSKIILALLSLLSAVVVGAVASASASAVMPAYTHADGSLITGQLSTLAANVTGIKPKLNGTLAGIKVEIVCEEEHDKGWIENSTVTGMGLSLAHIHYLKCTMPKPAGGNCSIPGELVLVLAHDLLDLKPGGGYLVLFFPDETHFASISVTCSNNPEINGTYPVDGTAAAVFNNSILTLEFTTTSGSNLTFGGATATYVDTVKEEMLGGGGIMIENGS